MYKPGQGNFIVLYAANNLGKSLQLDLLEALWQELEKPYVRLKYPIYDSDSGRLINQVLREGLPLSDLELQRLFAQNRHEFQPQLEWYLKHKLDVLTEDYVGTGLAWGLTRGVSRTDLDRANQGLLESDIAILLDGQRFTSGIEKDHRHEQSGVWEKNRQIHRELGHEFGWEVVNANQSPEAVHQQIVEKIFASV
jgi:thymidylate kinase